MTRLPDFAQGVVSLDIGPGFGGERQGVRRLYGWWVDWLSVDQPVQHIQNMGLGRRASLQCQFDGGEHGLFVMLENQSQDLDHLSVVPGVLSMRCCRARKAGGSSAKGAPLRRAPGL